MKKVLFILMAVLALYSCGKDDDPSVEPTLSIEPVELSFTAQATESHDVAVTTNQSSWEAVSSQFWCTVTKGNGKFTVRAAPNTSTSSPTPAVITVSAGNAKPVSINVTQSGVGAELKISPDTPVSFTSTGGESEAKTITVTTNQSSWNVASNQTWCIVGKSGNNFTVSVSENKGAEARNAMITVSAGNAANVTINVSQAGVGAQLSVSPYTPVTFTNAGGTSEAKTITVTTNQSSWNAVSNQTWCSITKSGNQFTVTASANTATTERKATITVSAGSAASITIEVMQTGVHAEDSNLEKFLTILRHTIYVKQQYDKGNRPTYITNSSGSAIAWISYTANGSLDEVYSITTGLRTLFIYSSPLFITEYSKNEAWSNIVDLAYGTYDYIADPAKAIGLFQNGVAQGNTFGTLEDLRRLSNNIAITEALFNKIIYPSGGHYRMIVFGKNSSGTLIGKYVGYSVNGETYIYWCIDPESPTFGQQASKNTPHN